MNDTARVRPSRWGRAHRSLKPVATSLLLALTAAACSHPMLVDVVRPPAAEFGFGPRTSALGLYQATVRPVEAIRVGQMHQWTIEVRDGGGLPVGGATIAVDGGMPEHGHGLPTQPRVTREVTQGTYQVEGMRFNMGGWWVVEFHIESSAGSDTVRFNLSL